MTVPEEDKYSVYREELSEKICELLGGRAAEEIVFDDFSGGASNDIERATSIARRMVTELGMSDVIGPINYASGQGEVFLGRTFSNTNSFSEDIAAKIDGEVHRIITEAHERAQKLLRENREKMDFIAEFLVKNEVMDGDQFKAVMEGNTSMEEVEEIAAAKRRKSKEADEEQARRNDERRAREEEEKRRFSDGIYGEDENAPKNDGDNDGNRFNPGDGEVGH
jgi:cell division protease FtsH